MGVAAENPRFDPDLWLADRLRRANACKEMASVLMAMGRQSSVPDIRWMAATAAEELSDAARRSVGHSPGRS